MLCQSTVGAQAMLGWWSMESVECDLQKWVTELGASKKTGWGASKIGSKNASGGFQRQWEVSWGEGRIHDGPLENPPTIFWVDRANLDAVFGQCSPAKPSVCTCKTLMERDAIKPSGERHVIPSRSQVTHLHYFA